MKKLLIVFSFCLASLVGYSQDPIETDAIPHLLHMDKVIDLSTDQEEKVLEIFKAYVKENKDLKKSDFAADQEYYKAFIDLYTDYKKKVYELLTPEQLEAYIKYRQEQKEKMMLKAQEDTEKIIQSYK